MQCADAMQVRGTVGMFIRDSHDNLFTAIQIRNQREHGIFVAQVDQDAATAATGNIFSDMLISKSGDYGMRINDASCVDNIVSNVQFIENTDGCFSDAPGSNPQLNGTICRP